MKGVMLLERDQNTGDHYCLFWPTVVERMRGGNMRENIGGKERGVIGETIGGERRVNIM